LRIVAYFVLQSGRTNAAMVYACFAKPDKVVELSHVRRGHLKSCGYCSADFGVLQSHLPILTPPAGGELANLLATFGENGRFIARAGAGTEDLLQPSSSNSVTEVSSRQRPTMIDRKFGVEIRRV
jgi:hypothetical protein